MPVRPRQFKALFALLPLRLAIVLAAFVLAGCGAVGLTESKFGALEIDWQEIHLNPEAPKQLKLGVLEYQGGLSLSSDAGNLGGLSGLVLTPKGEGFIAVTDRSDLLRATFLFGKDGDLEGLANASLQRLRDIDGKYISNRPDNRDQDAEAITRRADGSYLVSFEVTHRVLHYEDLSAQPSLFPMPPGLKKAPRNGGLEAMTLLPDGRTLVLTEMYRTNDQDTADYIGWLLDAEGESLGQIYWPASGLYRPAGLAALPNGDVLLLQRRYTVAGGMGMRLAQIPAAQIKPGARMLDLELARMAPPLSVDNFEGLAVHPDPAGGWTIYLLSDDNFNPLQRTLLLRFHLPEKNLN